MSTHTLKSKLLRYIDAGFPIIYLDTFEESKVDNLILESNIEKELYEWNGLNGYIDFETKAPMFEDLTLEQMLDQFKDPELLEGKLLILKDISPYMQDPQIVSKLKGLAQMITLGVDATILLVSNVLHLPKELEKYTTILELDYMNTDEIKVVIQKFINDYDLQAVKESLIDELALAFKGLTEFEINSLLALAYADDGELSKRDVNLIFDQKQQMIKKAGILEMIPLKETIDDIGGLEKLKGWFKRKSVIYKDLDKALQFGVDMPKGVLIVGVPGCGKSLNAKAAAHLFEVPLLRLDMGRLMGKYVGESEANFRKAIALAEAVSPCVLWVDELEKAFSGIGGSGGGAEVTTRLFGNFLTWMQEKKSPTFVVATANDVMKLPPELLRKGRFDDIYFVNLPNEKEREKIFEIHIKKRRPKDLSNINISQLVQKSKGYSGADIESVVKEAVELAFAEKRNAIQTNDILNAMKETQPIADLMQESLNSMVDAYKKMNFKNASR